jgi:hypothetical protein
VSVWGEWVRVGCRDVGGGNGVLDGVLQSVGRWYAQSYSTPRIPSIR